MVPARAITQPTGTSPSAAADFACASATCMNDGAADTSVIGVFSGKMDAGFP
jgi:hypothetical protein